MMLAARRAGVMLVYTSETRWPVVLMPQKKHPQKGQGVKNFVPFGKAPPPTLVPFQKSLSFFPMAPPPPLSRDRINGQPLRDHPFNMSADQASSWAPLWSATFFLGPWCQGAPLPLGPRVFTDQEISKPKKLRWYQNCSTAPRIELKLRKREGRPPNPK